MGWQTKYYDPQDNRTKNVPSIPRAYSTLPCREPMGYPDPKELYRPQVPPARYSTTMRMHAIPTKPSPSTKIEEWSTLRQMMPSQGSQSFKPVPENWGTGGGYPSKYVSGDQQPSFNRVNSAMSRFAHDSWFHDRNFKMF